MGLEGVVEPNHAPMNRFELIVIGLPTIFFVKTEGLEEELEVVDLPDRTQASGGNTKPIEFTAESMVHHLVEKAAMEVWFNEGKGDVTPTYKKNGTLLYKRIDGGLASTLILSQLFIKKRKYPDGDVENPGDPGRIVWTFSAKLIV